MRQYPILSIEDGMAEDDWAGWKLLTDKVGQQVQLAEDDLFFTDIATQIKTGSLCRSDYVDKYHRLLVIEDELGSAAS